jgi:hypothetical protein
MSAVIGDGKLFRCMSALYGGLALARNLSRKKVQSAFAPCSESIYVGPTTTIEVTTHSHRNDGLPCNGKTLLLFTADDPD